MRNEKANDVPLNTSEASESCEATKNQNALLSEAATLLNTPGKIDSVLESGKNSTSTPESNASSENSTNRSDHKNSDNEKAKTATNRNIEFTSPYPEEDMNTGGTNEKPVETIATSADPGTRSTDDRTWLSDTPKEREAETSEELTSDCIPPFDDEHGKGIPNHENDPSKIERGSPSNELGGSSSKSAAQRDRSSAETKESIGTSLGKLIGGQAGSKSGFGEIGGTQFGGGAGEGVGTQIGKSTGESFEESVGKKRENGAGAKTENNGNLKELESPELAPSMDCNPFSVEQTNSKESGKRLDETISKLDESMRRFEEAMRKADEALSRTKHLQGQNHK